MFYFCSFTPSKIRGTIKTRHPVTGLGRIIDINGVAWDVEAICGHDGKQIVCAVKEDHLHPYYKDTSYVSFGYVRQKWEPYELIVVGA